MKEIIVSQLGVDEDEVTLEASFVDDLGADSLDMVEFVLILEEEFNIEVPETDADKIVRADTEANNLTGSILLPVYFKSSLCIL